MGHLVGKDIYRKLGKKIDGLSLRAPYTKAFSALVHELYSEEEAQLIVKMPFRPSSISRIARTTGIPDARLQLMLDKLCDAGLIMDIWHPRKKQFIYMAMPFIVGIYEFTLMRTGDPDKSRHWAQLLNAYLSEEDLYRANISKGQQIGIMRTIPHDDAILLNDYVEIFDYQRARTIVEQAKVYSIGICSCRHEAMHMNEKKCDVPLETCCSFGRSAEYLIRHKLARQVDKQEMLDSLARAQESGLVLNGENVKRNMEYICQCCSCCCHLIKSINKHGYQGILVTSGLLPSISLDLCKGCEKCLKACPVHAISKEKLEDHGHEPEKKLQGVMPSASRDCSTNQFQCASLSESEFHNKKFTMHVDAERCIGCTVCQRACANKAILMGRSDKKVIYPEDGLEKYILSCLERETLQNILFDDPQKMSHEFMRTFLGAFLRLPPVKRVLLSDFLRSRFLKMIKG